MCFFHFKIIMIVLVSSTYVMGLRHYKYFIYFSAGTVFIRQIMTTKVGPPR